MNVEKNNKITATPRILVAPLDWGLGHATRCISLIALLIKQNIEVILAGEGAIVLLLEKEFPGIVILPLKGYRIHYGKSKTGFLLKMLSQFPKIISAIIYENKWLDKTLIKYKLDAVISDNRFGLYTKRVPCTFMTHQLFIQSGNRFVNRLAQRINYYCINKYDECWVPDTKGTNNLAGELSHPKILPRTLVKYLGILSRCKKLDLQKKFDLVIMISGPEPQRTIFENIVLAQLDNLPGSIVLLRGLPAGTGKLTSLNKNVTIFDHLPAKELNELLQRSEIVLARCGYSTIMDLTALKQKAILVPTPGQTEQEYLAKYLKEKKIFYTTTQENFSLEQEMKLAKSFEFAAPDILSTMNEDIVLDWLKKIKQRGKTSVC